MEDLSLLINKTSESNFGTICYISWWLLRNAFMKGTRWKLKYILNSQSTWHCRKHLRVKYDMQRGHVLYQFWIPINKLDNLAVCVCNSVHLWVWVFFFFTSVSCRAVNKTVILSLLLFLNKQVYLENNSREERIRAVSVLHDLTKAMGEFFLFFLSIKQMKVI